MMIKKFIQFLQNYSIDVAIGAVCASLFFQFALDVNQIKWEQTATLLFAVIGIYTFDHLYDLNRIDNQFISSRRKQHLVNKLSISFTSIISVLIAIYLSFFIPSNVFWTGVGIAGFMVLYFISIFLFELDLLKDFGVTLGYVLGIWLPIQTLSDSTITIADGLLIFLFFLNTFLIMLMYSIADHESDKKEQLKSDKKLSSSKKAIHRFIKIIHFINILLILISLLAFQNILVLFILSQWIILVLSFRKTEKRPRMVRFIGEWSYLIYAGVLLI